MKTLLFWDYVSVSVVGLYAYPILKCIELRSLDLKWIVCLFGLFMMHVITTIIKRLTFSSLKSFESPSSPTLDLDAKNHTTHWSMRPVGASNCDILCRNGDQHGRPGFPSGHMATVGFFTVYWLICNPIRIHEGYDCFSVQSIFVIYTILVALARQYKKCHTWLQICTCISTCICICCICIYFVAINTIAVRIFKFLHLPFE